MPTLPTLFYGEREFLGITGKQKSNKILNMNTTNKLYIVFEKSILMSVSMNGHDS